MAISSKRRLYWLLAALLVWALVFTSHGYLAVSSSLGQCCGYEGELGFLIVFFIMWPGLLYFAVPISLLLIWLGVPPVLRKEN